MNDPAPLSLGRGIALALRLPLGFEQVFMRLVECGIVFTLKAGMSTHHKT